MSIRDKILNVVNDTPAEIVEVPEWGVEVLVKGFTLGAKDEFLASVINADTNKADLKAFSSGVLIGTAFDPETNERLFSELDIPVLKQKSAVAIQRLVDVGTRLSGLTDEAVEVAGKKSSSIVKEEPSS
jgi:hypothetical protein